MMYVLIGMIIGMLLMSIINIFAKRTKEKQYFNEYKEIIDECLKTEKNISIISSENQVKKKESKLDTRK